MAGCAFFVMVLTGTPAGHPSYALVSSFLTTVGYAYLADYAAAKLSLHSSKRLAVLGKFVHRHFVLCVIVPISFFQIFFVSPLLFG